MQHNPIDDRSGMVKVMAWCTQETNYYLSQSQICCNRASPDHGELTNSSRLTSSSVDSSWHTANVTISWECLGTRAKICRFNLQAIEEIFDVPMFRD